MHNILFSTNSGFLASTLVDKMDDQNIRVSVTSPDNLYFSAEENPMKGIDMVILAGNITVGDKIFSKLKKSGVKKIIDATIVVDESRLSKLNTCPSKRDDYIKIPLAETTFIYHIAEAFDNLEIKNMFVSLMLSSSHYGDIGVEEITNQTVAIFNQGEVTANLFKERLAFNIIPLVNKANSAGYLAGITAELKEIFRQKKIKKFDFNTQVVLVPTLSSTGAIFTIKTKKDIDLKNVLNAFKKNKDLFKVYKDTAIVPVNSDVNDGKIHIASISVVDKRTLSFYAVADNVWTLSIKNIVRCLKTMS